MFISFHPVSKTSCSKCVSSRKISLKFGICVFVCFCICASRICIHICIMHFTRFPRCVQPPNLIGICESLLRENAAAWFASSTQLLIEISPICGGENTTEQRFNISKLRRKYRKQCNREINTHPPVMICGNVLNRWMLRLPPFADLDCNQCQYSEHVHIWSSQVVFLSSYRHFIW